MKKILFLRKIELSCFRLALQNLIQKISYSVAYLWEGQGGSGRSRNEKCIYNLLFLIWNDIEFSEI